jgi:hypothetical protein
MKTTLGFMAVLLVAGSSISYFKYERDLPATNSGGQHYAVVDETVWSHAQPSLNDVRLYSSGKEVPYALEVEQGGSETELKAVRVLQPASVGGKTQFLLDMSGVPEYDRIQLDLASRNFVSHARVEGQDDAHGAQWAVLGTTTVYDLSDENLGHNSTLQIPVATYKYLRVTIDGTVKPSDIQSATAGVIRTEEAVWRTIAIAPTSAQVEKDTVITFAVPDNVPVERVAFDVNPAQSNFRRDVDVQSGKGQSYGSGAITRIHMQRGGAKVDIEETTLGIDRSDAGSVKVIVHNGDDVPLPITAAHLQQYERRIYFDASAGTPYQLYYGDAALDAPVYDYAKLFQVNPSASAIPLGAEETNAAYKGRPDERPWSERHPAILWIAILAAVLTLGGIALRSMRSANT